MTGSESIARSFMMLSFFTAALLVGVYGFQQSRSQQVTAVPRWLQRDRPQPAPSASPAPPSPLPSQAATPQGNTSFGGSAAAPSEVVASPAKRATTQAVALQPTSPQNGAIQPAVHALIALDARSPAPPPTTLVSMRPMLQVLSRPALVIDLSDRQVRVYRGNLRKATYEVAIGKAGWETPVGEFRVIDKQVDPHWKHPITQADIPPGPGNPLGTRWIAFWTDGQHYIGFHGTQQTDLIGQAVSHGCVRMRNEDIEALYDQVVLGTPVIVQP